MDRAPRTRGPSTTRSQHASTHHWTKPHHVLVLEWSNRCPTCRNTCCSMTREGRNEHVVKENGYGSRAGQFAGRWAGSRVVPDGGPTPTAVVRGPPTGRRTWWSSATMVDSEQLGALCQEDRLEKVVEHTCKVRRGTRDSKGKGRQGGKSRAFKSGQALPRSRLKYTGVGRPPWTKVWRSFHAVWVSP